MVGSTVFINDFISSGVTRNFSDSFKKYEYLIQDERRSLHVFLYVLPHCLTHAIEADVLSHSLGTQTIQNMRKQL